MDEVTSSLSGSTESQATTVSETPSTSINPGAAATASAGSQATTGTPNADAYDPEWYKKDDRWVKRGMWKSEQDIIRSYYEADKVLETKYKPAYKQYEDLQKKFKDSGIDPTKLDEYVKEYQGYKDPNNPLIARSNYFSNWLDNDLYRDNVIQFFQDLETREQERKYPNMTAEARQKMIELEKRAERLEQVQKQAQEEKMYQTYQKDIQAGIGSIKKMAEANGFEFTDEIKDQFLDHCMKNGVPAKYMVQEFRSLHDEDLNKSYENKIKASLLASQQEQNKTRVTVAKAPVPTTDRPKSFRDQLAEKILGKQP